MKTKFKKVTSILMLSLIITTSAVGMKARYIDPPGIDPLVLKVDKTISN